MPGSETTLLRRILQMPISRRLPVVTLAMAGMIALMGGILYLQSYRNAVNGIGSTIELLAKDQVRQVSTWYDTTRRGLLHAAAEPSTAEAIRFLSGAVSRDGGKMDAARAAYVTGNPHPLGERQALVDAGDGSAYSAAHSLLHPRLDRMRLHLGYYDLFLFDTKGTLLYTAVKEADFGQDFVDGPFADTGLGRAYRQALAATGDAVNVADFEPYAPSADAPAAFLAVPVRDEDGKVVGVLAAQLSVEALSANLTSSQMLGEKGDMYMVGSDGRARTRSRFDGRFVEYDLLPDRDFLTALLSGQTGMFFGVAGITGQPSIVYTLPVPLAFGDWTLVLEVDEAEEMAAVRAFGQRVLLFVGLGLAAGLALGLLASRSITVPLRDALRSIEGVAGGDLSTDVPVAARLDEIGNVGRAVLTFRDKLVVAHQQEVKRQRDFGAQEMVTERMTVLLEALSKGDLSRTLDERFPWGFEPMRKHLNHTIETLRGMLGDVAGEADEMRARGEQIARSTDELSRRTETQAATLEETAAALDELTASVRSAAESVAEVETVVRSARDDAEASGKVMNDAVSAMSRIKQASDGISRIISVIDDIAFQTNLLALNAGVEAARAGEAGRGFAVVASEVRALSQRSSDAAKEIKDLISNSSVQVETGVTLVNRAGGSLSAILDRVGNVATLVGGIANGAREQSQGLAEINAGVTELDKVTQRNTHMVEEVTTASGVLKQRAASLREKVAQFRLEAVEPVDTSAAA